MNHIWTVFRYELMRNIRRKGYLFATFGLPLLGVVLMLGFHIYQTNFANPQETATDILEALTLERVERMGYVDQSGLFASTPESLQSILVAYPSEDAARQALNAEEIDAFFVVAEDYLQTGHAILHLPGLQIMLLEEGESIMQQLALRSFAPDLDAQTLMRLTNEPTINYFDLTQDAENGTSDMMEDGRFFVIYIFTLIFFVGLMLTNSYLMQTVIEERENKLIEILIATVRPVNLLGGKILALGGMGMVQIIIWITSTVLLAILGGNLSTIAPLLASLNIELTPSLLLTMVVIFVLMYLLYAVVFGAIGAISGSTQEGSQYVGLIVLPTLLPFYFFPLIQADPNGLVSTVFTLVPFLAPVTILIRMIAGTIPDWQILVSISLMVVTVIGSFWLAGRLFRVQTLLSGKSFKIKDLPALLFSERVPV
jgi:ABC-2 type transport system permease protein